LRNGLFAERIQKPSADRGEGKGDIPSGGALSRMKRFYRTRFFKDVNGDKIEYAGLLIPHNRAIISYVTLQMF
jgi:hypothetical protein